MGIGKPKCAQCKANPLMIMNPCGHTTCNQHYYETDMTDDICGICDEKILTMQESITLPPTLGPFQPNDTTWSPSHGHNTNWTVPPEPEDTPWSSPKSWVVLKENDWTSPTRYGHVQTLNDIVEEDSAPNSGSTIRPGDDTAEKDSAADSGITIPAGGDIAGSEGGIKVSDSPTGSEVKVKLEEPGTPGSEVKVKLEEGSTSGSEKKVRFEDDDDAQTVAKYESAAVELIRKYSSPGTPTRSPRKGIMGGNTNGSSSNTPVYRPPHLRGQTAARPSSSSSSDSFSSQHQSTFTSPGDSDGLNTPSGRYRYGERVKNMSPFDSVVQTPTQSRNSSNSALVKYQMQDQDVKINNGGIQAFNSMSGRNNLLNRRRSPSGSFPLPPPPGADHATKAAYFANLIKAGYLDDPRDPDFGNPGPSRRPGAPQPSPPKIQPGVVPPEAPKDGEKIHQYRAEHNTNGNSIAFVNAKEISVPQWFRVLPYGYTPSFEDVMKCIPITEPCRVARPSTAGVVAITNIPYSTSRAEIVALLGNSAKIIAQPPGSPFLAVHIMMDRQSGKTLDAYVEVDSVNEAKNIVSQMKRRAMQKRTPKLGDRPVEVLLSSQDLLMHATFPYGKKVSWMNGKPVIDEIKEELFPGVYSKGYDGFMLPEEITHMIKHADTPQRSSFTQRCLIRTYECMITTLYKYPWHAPELILDTERIRLYSATKDMIICLLNMLPKINGNRQTDRTKPSTGTLKELATAALVCPGFGEREKAQIVTILRNTGYHQLTTPKGMNLTFGGNHAFSADWPFRIIVKQPGIPDQIMEYFASLVRDATRYEQVNFGVTSLNFGNVIVNYSGSLTLADYAIKEVLFVGALLERVLKRNEPKKITKDKQS